MQDLPAVCMLTPDAMQERNARLRPGILAGAESIDPLADGYRVRLAASGGRSRRSRR